MRESILLFHISDKEVKKKVERALLPLRVRHPPHYTQRLQPASRCTCRAAGHDTF